VTPGRAGTTPIALASIQSDLAILPEAEFPASKVLSIHIHVVERPAVQANTALRERPSSFGTRDTELLGEECGDVYEVFIAHASIFAPRQAPVNSRLTLT
jgi:hypothetical protein